MKRRGDSLSYGGWDTVRGRESNWTYTTGLLMEAMDDVAVATGNETLAAYAKRTMDSYLAEDGVIHTYKAADFNIDHINPGKMLQRLYEKYGDEKYLDAINTLAAQFADHPRTSEGAFWHKKRYPHQLWLDGVYMGMPFLAGVGALPGSRTLVAAIVLSLGYWALNGAALQVLAHVKDGRVTKLKGNPAHPLSRGKLCPRGAGGTSLLYDPDRLKRPMIRRNAKRGEQVFEEVTWKEALDYTAENPQKIKDKYGASGVMFSSTEGLQEHFFREFSAAFGSANHVRHPTLCLASGNTGFFSVFGVVPALRAGSVEAAAAIHRVALRTTTGRRERRGRSVLVGLQIALSLSLLAGAGSSAPRPGVRCGCADRRRGGAPADARGDPYTPFRDGRNDPAAAVP